MLGAAAALLASAGCMRALRYCILPLSMQHIDNYCKFTAVLLITVDVSFDTCTAAQLEGVTGQETMPFNESRNVQDTHMLNMLEPNLKAPGISENGDKYINYNCTAFVSLRISVALEPYHLED